MLLKRVAVVGAGPAGLMAAGQASKGGAEVFLFDQNRESGKKLLLTGHGRCNLTNIVDEKEFLKAFNNQAQPFLRHSLRSLSNSKLMTFFENELNVKLVQEKYNKIYPSSGKSSEVRDALQYWAVAHKVQLMHGIKIQHLELNNNSIVSVIDDNNTPYYVDAVILACGGASYPTTGSDGSGYTLAESIGHTVKKALPALAPLDSPDGWVKSLQGLDLDDVELTLYVNGKHVEKKRGDLLFTHFGLTGPLPMDISAAVSEAISSGASDISVDIDLFPDKTPSELSTELVDKLNSSGKKKIENVLSTLMPDRYAEVILQRADLSPDKLSHQFTKQEREAVIKLLKGNRVSILKTKPLSMAMVTRGGISLDEVDSRTMRSKLVSNLFFAGEILDIDGRTGGFNLQAAFSTGFVAGKNCM
ncbi:MAG: NAD(P)/FAD-dependent oxidoreductase [Fibrobacteres bacterium]|nr:NAD(P)/FAD-dependent oxidoreductase [Fibrobacterota bacterium]